MKEATDDVDRDTLKQSSLDEELLILIAGQGRSSPYTVSLAMGIIAYLIYRHIPAHPWVWGGWFALVLLSQLYRMNRLAQLPRNTHIPVARRKREAVLLNIFCRAIQSLSLIAFPLYTPFEASVQTLIFMSMGVGPLVNAVGWAPYTRVHIFITLLPVSCLWLWSGIYGSTGTLGLMVAIVVFAYGLTEWIMGKRVYRMHSGVFAHRAALALALDKAEAAGAAKTRFLASSSHDLRQPLQALSLLSGTLHMLDLDDKVRKISDSMESSIVALSSELDSLLDISKLDAGIVPVLLTHVNLASILERLCQEAKAPAKTRAISIHVECPQDSGVHTDPALLERIVRNVLTNAITHNRGCALHVAASLNDDHWELEIRDTGSGIALAEQGKVFEEFYQSHNPERDRSKGLGLGLSIVLRLSKLLDLKMEFESIPNTGTRFKFKIPLATGELPVAGDTEKQAVDLRNLNILIVDDDIAVRNSMSTLLEALGCLVSGVNSTDAAIVAARSTKPDIALIDYRLRDTDSGLKTLVSLRELYIDLPAIMISGDTAPDRLREAKMAGVRLLIKPVYKDELCSAIAAACGTRMGSESSPLSKLR
jgi:signal transduction histidine kinase/CheY-like chemotaxis protein